MTAQLDARLSRWVDAQVCVDDCCERIAWRLGDRGHRLPAIVERAFDRFGHEFVTRLEVAVEAPVREPCLVHQVGHPDPVDPVLAEARRSHADDLFMVPAFVRSRMSHALPSLCLFDIVDDGRHPAIWMTGVIQRMERGENGA